MYFSAVEGAEASAIRASVIRHRLVSPWRGFVSLVGRDCALGILRVTIDPTSFPLLAGAPLQPLCNPQRQFASPSDDIDAGETSVFKATSSTPIIPKPFY